MKRSIILSLTVTWTAALFAQQAPTPPPRIDNISPRSGPTAGGIDVTITGANLQPHIFCILPCPTLVTFGDASVEPYRVTDSEITVKAPAHPSATVDVTVAVPGGGSTTAPQAFTFTDSLSTTWEPVLLPVYIDGAQAGAANSQWRTNLWIQNGGKENLTLAPWECPGQQVCPAIFPLTKTLASGEAQHNLPAMYAQFAPRPGRLLYFNRSAANGALMSLRVVDDASVAVDSGTEVPVIRERNLLTSATTLINVPLLNNRLLLRVYDVALESSQFHVRVFVQSEAVSAGTLTETSLDASSADHGDLRMTPAYAEYPIQISFGPVLLTKDAAVRVEVTPLTAGSRYWAFVSATNNNTNHVTLVTPQ